jgi:phosphoribosyl 1,2-cyclic phosphodiesterase
LNIVHPFNNKENQLSSDDAVKIINKVKPKLTIITHFGIKMLKADPLYEAREIQKKTGVQIIAAKDGMVINPISYSAGLRQRTLTMYK